MQGQALPYQGLDNSFSPVQKVTLNLQTAVCWRSGIWAHSAFRDVAGIVNKLICALHFLYRIYTLTDHFI